MRLLAIIRFYNLWSVGNTFLSKSSIMILKSTSLILPYYLSFIFMLHSNSLCWILSYISSIYSLLNAPLSMPMQLFTNLSFVSLSWAETLESWMLLFNSRSLTHNVQTTSSGHLEMIGSSLFWSRYTDWKSSRTRTIYWPSLGRPVFENILLRQVITGRFLN